jgi:hypothetical protein
VTGSQLFSRLPGLPEGGGDCGRQEVNGVRFAFCRVVTVLRQAAGNKTIFKTIVFILILRAIWQGLFDNKVDARASEERDCLSCLCPA